MRTIIETYDLSSILQPAQEPQDARQDALQFGPNLTITKGQSIGIKTADHKAYGINATGLTNEVQTLNFAGSPSGNFILEITDQNGVVQETPPITYSATAATLVSNIQTGINAVIPQVSSTNQIVSSGTLVTAIALTFSGVNFAGKTQPMISINSELTAGEVSISRTTTGGESDGTGSWVGFSMYSFKTDANGLIYWGDVNNSPSWRTGPWTTAPVWKKGIFNPAELLTGTAVAQVDTDTPASLTIGDILELTATDNALNTYVYPYTVAVATAAAVVAAFQAIIAKATDPVLSQITATGTVTLILTGKPGIAFTVTPSVVSGTTPPTFTRAATTPASGISLATVQQTVPGARLLHNGFWYIP